MSLRSVLVAIVAVLTLLGGAVRPSTIDALRTRAALERVERTTEGGDRAHLEHASELSRVRAARPASGPDPSAGDALALRSFASPMPARAVASPSAPVQSRRSDVAVRRVRPHVENMVFLI